MGEKNIDVLYESQHRVVSAWCDFLWDSREKYTLSLIANLENYNWARMMRNVLRLNAMDVNLNEAFSRHKNELGELLIV